MNKKMMMTTTEQEPALHEVKSSELTEITGGASSVGNGIADVIIHGHLVKPPSNHPLIL
jgi:hypothetical protein